MGSVKKALKPITKVVDDIIPNEIKPALPYIAATFGAPYLSPLVGKGLASLGMRGIAPFVTKGLAGGIANVGTQALLGKKINPMSALFSAGTAGIGEFLKPAAGFVGPPTGLQKVLGDVGSFISPGKIGEAGLTTLGEIGTAATVPGIAGTADAAGEAARKANEEYEQYLAEQEAAGAEDIQTRADYISRYMGLAGFGQEEINETLNNLGYAANGGLMGTRVGYKIGGSTVSNFLAKFGVGRPDYDSLMTMFEQRKREIFNSMFDPEAGTGAYSMEQMQQADDMATKQATQELNEYMEKIGMDLMNPPEDSMPKSFTDDEMIDQVMDAREKSNRTPGEMARDNILDADSSIPMNTGNTMLDKFSLEDFQDSIKKLYEGRNRFKDGGYDPAIGTKKQYEEYLDDLESDIISPDTTFNEWMDNNAPDPDYDYSMKDGGIMNLKMGGMPMEMDLRGGGFVPIGAKERADDVPARLSKNEFVMTADAVRAAGGGSVNKGAKKMYDLMNKLEARV